MLIIDPLDSGVGAQIEKYAKAHGVVVIDYDRLTLAAAASTTSASTTSRSAR